LFLGGDLGGDSGGNLGKPSAFSAGDPVALRAVFGKVAMTTASLLDT
jgi:hypothetical protein